jgi:hypothetical protein
MPECNELLRSYFEWLRTETVCTQDEGFFGDYDTIYRQA